MRQGLSSFLNASRGVAAALVLFNHVRHLLLTDFYNVEHKTVFDRALYFLTGFGHEAVVIFFVISGYLVGGLTLKRWKARGPDLAHYSAARISRIYTVLVPTLVIGFTLDFLGRRWLNSSDLYTAYLGTALDPRAFFGNLFMLQGILTSPLGTNGPLWSLAYEWWYYCAFALAAMAIISTRPTRFLYVAGVLALGLVLPVKFVLWSSIWTLGVLTAYWVESNLWRPSPILGLALFSVAMVCSRLSHNVETATYTEPLRVEFGRDALLTLAYCVCVAGMSRLRTPIPMARQFDWLASFSYTTYLCHFPGLIAVVALAYQVLGLEFHAQPSAASLCYSAACSAILYLYAFLIYWVTERHTDAVRDWLSTRFQSVRSAFHRTS